MKKHLKKFISIINKAYLTLSPVKASFRGSRVYLFKINADKRSHLNLLKSDFQRSSIQIEGDSNCLDFNESLLVDTSITISGNHNKIVLAEGVKLRKTTIIIRGNHCTISIGANSSFGEIRMVNVGNNCDITIGKDCLFADNIELWASDTHPIYDNNQQVINPEESVVIKDNVWVGNHVTILKGVTIDSGSVVGMGTMVTKDIPAKVISVGNPNRTIKHDISWSLNYEGEK